MHVTQARDYRVGLPDGSNRQRTNTTLYACMHATHEYDFVCMQARDYRVGLPDGSNRQVEHAERAANHLLRKDGMCHNLQVVRACKRSLG